MSITEDPWAQRYGFEYLEDGSVTTPRGFKASGIHAGFRKNAEKLDLALIVSDHVCPVAALFTQNEFCAAPVQFSKAQLMAQTGRCYGYARSIVINSGNANAATGKRGQENAAEVAQLTSAALKCPEDEVLISSTGVIGVQLPMEPFRTSLSKAAEELSSQGGHEAALAIMTTDTHPKECAVEFSGDKIGFPGVTFTVGGISKGSGMIMPDMATMIAVLTTDAPILPEDLHVALVRAVDCSFNKITVDSDTSTNDSCFLMASGDAMAQSDVSTDLEKSLAAFKVGTLAHEVFTSALTQVCVSLARDMVRDGEGATKIVDVTVRGAKTPEDADLAARTIANSPLVKTAIAGHDANWGRIAAALGRSGADFKQEDVDIDIMGLPACCGGLSQALDEEEALRRFEEDEIVIEVNLNAGKASATIWTCDLTHDYISINGDYRS